MRFKLEFHMDNAAFADDPAPEVGRLVEEVSEMVRSGRREGWVWDINGNKIGAWGISSCPAEDERVDDNI